MTQCMRWMEQTESSEFTFTKTFYSHRYSLRLIFCAIPCFSALDYFFIFKCIIMICIPTLYISCALYHIDFVSHFISNPGMGGFLPYCLHCRHSKHYSILFHFTLAIIPLSTPHFIFTIIFLHLTSLPQHE